MLSNDPNRAHRDTVNIIRRKIKNGKMRTTEEVIIDLREFDDANTAYIQAKTEFSTFNSDRTMINLIGTWARIQGLIRKMDAKYGF